MRIGGLIKCSLIDYPGKISAVIFTQGCNFRCPFCHNPELVYSNQFQPALKFADIINFLKSRKKQLDGVVFSGGEPTIHRDLFALIKQIKSIGFFVKLDTNGSHPNYIKKLLKNHLLDFIAMDIKAPQKKYNPLSGVDVMVENILQSIRIIETSKIAYQFRTTYYKKYLNDYDIEEIRSQLSNIKNYSIQDCSQ